MRCTKGLIPLLLLIGTTSPAQVLSIRQYPLPANASETNITAGPDGALWFTEFSRNMIGRITTTGKLTEYTLSAAPDQPNAITAGPDGALWFTEYGGNKIGRITTAGAITHYFLPTAGAKPSRIIVGSDGALWFLQDGSNKIGRITTTGRITEFVVGSLVSRGFDLAAGPDGALWFSEWVNKKIGRITTSGEITEYAVPLDGFLSGICAGPDGALWFTHYSIGNIGTNLGTVGRITTTGVVTLYALPPTTRGFTKAPTVGPDGAIWFVEGNGTKIGRITTSGVVTETAVPGVNSITPGPDGALWYTGGEAIWRVVLAKPAFTRQNLSSILGFENSVAGAFPAGWTGSNDAAGALPASVILTDGQTANTGKNSARILRSASTPGSFSGIFASIPLDFAGKTLTLRASIKTDNASDAVLWVRENGGSSPTQALHVTGTTGWKRYSLDIALAPVSADVSFGFLLNGTGSGWVDDLELLADGAPIAMAGPRFPTALDTDKQFDNGSLISLSTLSNIQGSNLATLAKVWGFLKYHHPAVASGAHHWDYQLFRIMPQVLAASSTSSANDAMSDWIARLGPVDPCSPCATLPSSNLMLNPGQDWISNTTLLGAGLSEALVNIYKNRPPDPSQFYVSLVPGVGNPSFDNELSYVGIGLPDSGYQLLALFRFWNMVQYFYPYRDVMADDPSKPAEYWDSVLLASIPKIGLAKDSATYQLELMRFIGAIHDTHASLIPLGLRPPVGNCQLPVNTRFVQGVPIIYAYLSPSAGTASGLLVGDVIEQLEGVPESELVSQWTPFYAASNQAARLRDIGQFMTGGACGPASVTVRRKGVSLVVSATRVPISSLDRSTIRQHNLPGPTFQLLNNDVAYLKLTSVKAADAASYVQSAANTKGLIIDIRGFPSEDVYFALGAHLVNQRSSFVRFTIANVANPGAFQWLGSPLALTPQSPYYQGKVVILVDETTQSTGEYTAMAFRAAPSAIVIGSTTAGADGNVSPVPLPGGLSSNISGLGIFYPDGRPTQRVGILPDIVVQPTIAGIQAGRDELVDEAIFRITGVRATSPAISRVANAVGGTPAITANAWVEIKGANLAPAGNTRTWAASDIVNGTLPVQLDGVSATVNGKNAFIYYISPTQVNILTPPDEITGPVTVVVNNNGALSAPYTAQARPVSPTLFAASGSYVLGQHANTSLIGPRSLSVPGYPFTPARPGETIVLFGNGFGPTSSAVLSGSATQSGILSTLPEFTIGGVRADVRFAGLIAPGQFQFNILVPLGIATGEHPIVASYKGATTQSDLLLAVEGISISTTAIFSGVPGSPYSQTFSATGGTAPYTWSLASGSLPPGLTLSPSGTISGTPQRAGLADITLAVADSQGVNTTRLFPLNIVNAPSYVITTVFNPTNTPGSAGALTLDSAGNTYVLSTANNVIWRQTPNGRGAPFAGTGTAGFSGDGGPAASAQIAANSGGIAMDNNNLYIADYGNNRIRVVSPAGTILTHAGPGTPNVSGDGGPVSAAELVGPSAVTFDSARNMFIAESGKNRIRLVQNGVIQTIVGGTPGTGRGDGGRATDALLTNPQALWVDVSGNLYIAEFSGYAVRKVTPAGGADLATSYRNGIITTIAGNRQPGAASNQVNPRAIAMDADGNLFIADRANSRVLELTPGGAMIRVAGTGTVGFAGDGGPAAAAQVGNPTGVVSDGSGRVYFSDQGNGRVRVLTPVSP